MLLHFRNKHKHVPIDKKRWVLMKDYCRIKNRTSEKLGLLFAAAWRMRLEAMSAAEPAQPVDATPNAGAAAAGA
eukprot:1207590-Amphidinium_carterae.1